MEKKKYDLHLKGYVGGEDFDADYVDYVLARSQGGEVNVLVDSLGGQINTALSIYAAFTRHGGVNVHFVGMNASAATVASLGAKHVSMDTSAMYLVHKCSTAVFEWGSLNADDLETLISHLDKEKKDLDKIDINIAQMYARRCKKTAPELLSLMKEGSWLTAAEAKDWGFVDEVTDYAGDIAPMVTPAEATALSEAGIPLPEGMAGIGEGTGGTQGMTRKMIDGIVRGMRQVFGGSVAQLSPSTPLVPQEESNQTSTISMRKEFEHVNALLKVEGVLIQDEQIVLGNEEMRAIDDALASRQARIDELESDLEDLRNRLKAVPDGAVFGGVTDGTETDDYADIRIDPVNFMEM